MKLLRGKTYENLSQAARNYTWLARQLAAYGGDDADDIARKYSDIPINAIVHGHLPELRHRSRNEYLNNPLFQRAVTSFTESIVGDGIKLRRDYSQDMSDAVAERIMSGFHEYMSQADYYGDLTEQELVKQAVRSILLDGEYFGMLMPEDGRMKVASVDPARIDVNAKPLSLSSAQNRVYNGIEFDPLGKKVGYYVYPYMPDSQSYESATATFVPFQRMIHIFQEDFVDQQRGLPFFQSSVPIYAATRKYDSNHAKSAELSAKFIMSLTADPNADRIPYPISNPIPGISKEKWESGEDPSLPVRLMTNALDKNKSIFVPPAGYTADVLQLRHPDQEFAEYTEKMQRDALGPLFSLVTGNMKEMNFITGRMLLLFNTDLYRDFQHKLITRLYRPLFLDFLGREIATPARGYRMRRNDAAKAFKFVPRSFPPIQPREIAFADNLALKNGTKLESEIVEERGEDYMEFLKKQARQDEMKKDILGEEEQVIPQEQMQQEQNQNPNVVPLNQQRPQDDENAQAEND